MIIPNQPAPLGRPPLSGGQPENAKLLTELQSEVSVEAAPLLQFIVRHMGLIVLVLVLFIIALAGTAGYNWYSERAATQAQQQLSRVVLTTQGAERVKALQDFVVGAPASVKVAGNLALADAAVAQQEYMLASQAFAQIAAADSKGAVGLLAALNEGQTLIRAGKAKEAIPLLEKLEALMPEAQRNMVRLVLAEAADQAGDKAKAAKIFESIAASMPGPDAEFYRFRAQSLTAAEKDPQ